MAAPQTMQVTPERRHKIDSAPRLIAADAALTLVERWRTELHVLRRRSPTSDAVKTLADCVDELTAAITAGHDVTVKLTVAEAHAVSRIPVSTLRWLCNRKPDALGAQKREGVWYIDRTSFERYLAAPNFVDSEVPTEPTPAARADEKIIALMRASAADSPAEAR